VSATVAAAVGVGVGVSVEVLVNDGVGVLLGVAVGVSVGVSVGVEVGVRVGVLKTADCATHSVVCVISVPASRENPATDAPTPIEESCVAMKTIA
jgi:hypothetical protein